MTTNDPLTAWLPSSAGVVHQMAIATLVEHNGEADLIVKKRFIDGRFTYSVVLTKNPAETTTAPTKE